MKKRILSLTLILMMCLTLIPVTALAAVGETLTFKTGDDEWGSVFTVSHALLSDETIIVGSDSTEVKVYYVLDGVSVITLIEGYDLYFSGIGTYPGEDHLHGLSPPLIIFSSNGENAESYAENYVDSDIYTLDEMLITYSMLDYYAPYNYDSYFIIGVAFKIVDELSDSPTETPSTWAIPEVSAAIEAGLVPQELQRNYKGSVTRGEVAQMFIDLIEKSSGQNIDALLAAKGVTINNNAFTDTTDKAVLAAHALGIIQGVGNNRFDPNGTLTRAQIAVLINRLARALDVDTAGYTHEFTDVAGHWSDAELGWPVHAGVIQGEGNNRFNPEGQLTIEQVIIITYRAFQSLKDISLSY